MPTNLTEKDIKDVDQVYKLLEPLAQMVTANGFGIFWIPNNDNAYHSRFNINLMNEYFGHISLGKVYSPDYSEAKVVPEISFLTRIIMETRTSFSKTNVSNKCNIRTSHFRSYTEDDIDKVDKWLKLLFMQYKTALAKKKKFEMDTDFE